MSARLEAAKVREEATGKWQSILSACGVDKSYLTNKHGPCPICEDGKDRFRFDDKDGRGTFYCSQCGSGDGFSLLQRLKGWDFRTALTEVWALAGSVRAVKVRTGRTEEQVRQEMNEIWRGARPLSEVEATRRWWDRRLGCVPFSQDLRAVMSLRCAGYPDHPAMVALVRGSDGKPVNIHRTYLTTEGDKAPVGEARRVMDIELPSGSAVRLSPAGDVLGVAEGIETAAACQRMFDVPTWALLNAGNMKRFVPPPGVGKVIVFGDMDASFTGQAAAFELARSLWARRKKHTPELSVEVRIYGVTVDPLKWNHDWNDALMLRLAAERTAAAGPQPSHPINVHGAAA